MTSTKRRRTAARCAPVIGFGQPSTAGHQLLEALPGLKALRSKRPRICPQPPLDPSGLIGKEGASTAMVKAFGVSPSSAAGRQLEAERRASQHLA